jgi:NAD(P)-dependent dehydrogenase (short-subunit alcohol dehydrogenase family)
MMMTYPFAVSGDEFKGKRVLVTGGTKGMGQAMVRRFTLSGGSVATTARSPMPEGQAVALFVQNGYRYGCRRARSNRPYSAGVGWN